jgi:hypothetical protein
MKIKLFQPIFYGCLSLLLLVGCSRPEEPTPEPSPVSPTPTTEVATGPARAVAEVESVLVNMGDTFPMDVDVIARGVLPDGCTDIETITQAQEGTEFLITITTLRQPDDLCSQAQVPFEETIALDVLDLPAGSYRVTVNGNTVSFTLSQDNVAAAEPEPTPIPEGETVIIGRIWHDECFVYADDLLGEIPPPSEGCMEIEDDQFQADGVMDSDEPGLAGIVITLSQGACPGTELTTTVTDDNGEYSFPELTAGTYCVAVDELAVANSELLLPGRWSFPAGGTAEAEVSVSAGEISSGLNFGWDYDFLPLPEVDPETCFNSIEFIDDVSIPDDTEFPPGAEFTKAWQIRNNGTCVWTEEYSLVNVGGDGLIVPESITLTHAVAPGETIELSVEVITPDEGGTYRENWQIADAAGQPFGVNGAIEDAFWLQVVVDETAEPTPPTGGTSEGTIGGIVWRDVCTFTAAGDPGAGCVETEEGSGVFRADGTLNFNEQGISGVTVYLIGGACPANRLPVAEDAAETAVTDERGIYRFFDMAPAAYCVYIDAFGEDNVDLLIPGDWTYPAYGTGRVGINLSPGQEVLTVDFGWEDR